MAVGAARRDDGRVGIRVGMQWASPLVALLDGEGQVVWQAQGVTDWAEVQRVAGSLAESP